VSAQPCPRPPCPCLGPDGPPKKPRCQGSKGKKLPEDAPDALKILREHLDWLIWRTPGTRGSRAGFRKRALKQPGVSDGDLPTENEISQQLSGREKYSDFTTYPEVKIITFFAEFCDAEDSDLVLGHLAELLDDLRKVAKPTRDAAPQEVAESASAVHPDSAVKHLVLETGAGKQQKQLLFAALRGARSVIENLERQLTARNVNLYVAYQRIQELTNQLAARQDEIDVRDAENSVLNGRLAYAEGKVMHADRKLEELDRLERGNKALRTRILQLLRVPVVAELPQNASADDGVVAIGTPDEPGLVDTQFEQIVNLYNLIEDKEYKRPDQEKPPDEGPASPAAKRPITFNRDGFLGETLLAMFIVTVAAAFLGIGIAAALELMI